MLMSQQGDRASLDLGVIYKGGGRYIHRTMGGQLHDDATVTRNELTIRTMVCYERVRV